MMTKLPVKIHKYIASKLASEPITQKMELIDYVQTLTDEIADYWVHHFPKREPLDEELLDLMDRNSSIYEQLCAYLLKNVQANASSYNRIYDHYGCTYVEPVIPASVAVQATLNGYMSIMNDWFYNAKKYATYYEQFCALFLQDYGFDEVTLTKRNGDAGVDIICVKQGDDAFGLYSLHALCQVKFYKTKADQAVIRSIIGDSTIIAFDRALYEVINHTPKRLIVISHNGFNEKAKKYARTRGVTLLDTAQMLQWVLKRPHYKNLTCIEFIEQFQVDEASSKMLNNF